MMRRRGTKERVVHLSSKMSLSKNERGKTGRREDLKERLKNKERERVLCTMYDVYVLMLPSSRWLHVDGMKWEKTCLCIIFFFPFQTFSRSPSKFSYFNPSLIYSFPSFYSTSSSLPLPSPLPQARQRTLVSTHFALSLTMMYLSTKRNGGATDGWGKSERQTVTGK
jgi:hypothetical protein